MSHESRVAGQLDGHEITPVVVCFWGGVEVVFGGEEFFGGTADGHDADLGWGGGGRIFMNINIHELVQARIKKLCGREISIS